MLIRDERSSDIPAISAVTDAAFKGHPHSSGTEARIIDALRAAGALAISLVTEDAGKIVGHIAFSPVRTGAGSAGWYALGPVAVLPARQRAGIGGELVRHGLSRLRAIGAAGCLLVGDPAYYCRFGFVLDPALTWRDLPAGYLQHLVLDGAAPRGDVSFHPAFDIA